LHLPRKVYFTEDFKELPSAENAVYYSTYEKLKGTQEQPTSLMVPNETVICFRITEKMKEGTSIEWHKTETKLREVYVNKTKWKGNNFILRKRKLKKNREF
jgi:protein TonB